MSNTSLLGSYGGLGGSGLSFRNILINGEVTRINQRGFGGNWAGLSVGDYGYDRWKKAGTDTMSQVVEEGNFIPGAQYTLSGTNVTTQTLTAPSSGHWTITVQQTARFVMLEAGPVATPFEHRPIGLEQSLCERYYQAFVRPTGSGYFFGRNSSGERVLISIIYPTNLRTIGVVTLQNADPGGATVSVLASTAKGVSFSILSTYGGNDNGSPNFSFQASAEL